MNHVFAGERSSSGSSWMSLVLVMSEGVAVLLSRLTFTPCVRAGQTAQSAVKAHVTVSSGDTTTREARWHYNQVVQVEDYRNPRLSDVNDMQLSSISPQMNLLFGTWTSLMRVDLTFPQYVKQWALRRSPEVPGHRHMLGKSQYAALHYQGVLFNSHVMCLSSCNWFGFTV